MQQRRDVSDPRTGEASLNPPMRAPPAEAGDQVLLALVDLAREQAAELAAQNDELRRQNEELARANRHKTEFLTTMSHELRTPLNAILGFSELLLEEIAGALSGGQAEYVTDIHRAGQNLLAMINDLLDLAKIDSGRMEFRRELIDLAVPVNEAADLVRAMALRKEQLLEVRVDGPVPCVCDAQRLRQVAINLLANAVKFTPRGGAVTVTLRAGPDRAEFDVRDSGIGIDAAHQAAIFEAFRQIDSSETREHQGTGLGLALVARFCEAMGGEVSVRSAPGEGATFTVRVPAPPADTASGNRPILGLLGDSGIAEELRQAALALGFEVDALGPAHAFALRAGTRVVVLELPDAATATRALHRVRTGPARRQPAVLVLLPARAGNEEALRALGAEAFHGGADGRDGLLARLRALGPGSLAGTT